jgi:high affinity sulfate transporter 1
MSRFFRASFQGYDQKHLKKDFLAALVVTAVAIPESLGFAAIVGLPVQTGLYCALLAPIVFALFTSSKHLVIGADSATAALVASGAATLAAAQSPHYAAVIALLGVLTGLILVAMGLLRFGFLADLISKPVLTGFLAGVGLQLILTHVAGLMAIPVKGSVLDKVATTLTHLPQAHWPTLALGVSVLVITIVAGKRKLPGALLGLVAALWLSLVFNLKGLGVHMIDKVPAGMPHLQMPELSLIQAATLFSSALAIAVVIMAQSLAVIRSSADKYDEPINDNHDLIALGFANIASSLTQGFAVNGSPPRTAVADNAGGRSQMVNIFMAVIIALILLFATDVLTLIPEAALAAIICAIGVHLINVRQIKEIWRMHKVECAIALLAMTSVALLGVQQGIMIAVLGSLVERLRREYRPPDAVLLRDGIIADWAEDRLDASHKYSSRPDGVIIYHFDGALFFENATYFVKRIQRVIKKAEYPVTCVILDAGSMSDIDYTGAASLRKIAQQLQVDDIRFVMAHASPRLQKVLESYELTELIGQENIYSTLREAVKNLPVAKRSTVEMVQRLKLPAHSYVVIGGGVLEALGIRDTMDVDLVVNQKAYDKFKAKGWKEYIQDDGKRLLSHKGYKVMLSWMNYDLGRLQKHAFMLDGVTFMSLDDLVKLKERLGRKKDKADIALIETYRKKQL